MNKFTSLFILSILVFAFRSQVTVPSISQCVNGVGNCLYCSSSTQCGACAYGFYPTVGSTYQCSSCANSGAQCSGLCSSQGFYTNGTQCLACAASSTTNCSASCLQNGYYTSGNATVGGCTASNGVRLAGNVTGATSFTNCNQHGVYSTPLTTGGVLCQICSRPGVYNCTDLKTHTSCLAGYQLSGSSCVACSTGSGACPTTCISAGFFTNTTSNQCLSCASSTFSCQSTCTAFGFYSFNSTSCQQCPSGAQVCPNGLATVCLAGYYLNAGGVCTACPAGQTTCLAQLNNPKTCQALNYLNSTSQTCITCVQASMACDASCITQGFYTVTTITGSTTTYSCTQCATGTTACTYSSTLTSVTASSCAAGYFLNVASTGVATCSSCLTTGASSTVGNNCADSSYFYPIVTDSLGTLNTGTTFTNCNSTYSSPSGAGVLTCNYLIGALTCAEGYFLQVQSSGVMYCVQCSVFNSLSSICSAGGLPYYSGSSSSCAVGYYYQSSNSTCQSCGTNAATCTIGSTITTSPTINTCNTGFYVNSAGSACVACSSPNSGACGTGCSNYFWDSTASACTLCPTNALVCTSSTAISSCNTGYYVLTTTTTSGSTTTTTQSCTSCPTGASACGYDSNNNINSITCKTGYYYGQGSAYRTCIACANNAVACEQIPQVQQCSSGYYNAIDRCIACYNMVGCSGSGCNAMATSCTFAGTSAVGGDLTCITGAYLLAATGNCVSCRYSACKTSLTTGVTTCSGCGTGCTTQGFYQTSTNQCIACHTNKLSNTAMVTVEAATSLLSAGSITDGTSPGLSGLSTDHSTNYLMYTSCTLQAAACSPGYYMTYGSTITCTACTATSQTTLCNNAIITAYDLNLAYTYATLGASAAPTSFALNVPQTYSGSTGSYTACTTSVANSLYCVLVSTVVKSVQCQTGYYPTYATTPAWTCTACPTANVFQCQTSTILKGTDAATVPASAVTKPSGLVCNSGYGVNNAGTACTQCGSGATGAITVGTTASFQSTSILYQISSSANTLTPVIALSCVMDGTGNIMSAITCAVGYYDKGTTYTTTPDHVCTACPTNSASCTATKVVCKSGYTPIGGTSIGGVTTGDTATDLQCVAVTSTSSYSNSAADALTIAAATTSPTPTSACTSQYGLYLFISDATPTNYACIKCSDALATGTNAANKWVDGWCNYYTGTLSSATFTSIALTAVTFSTGLAAVTPNSQQIWCTNGYYAVWATTSSYSCTVCPSNALQTGHACGDLVNSQVTHTANTATAATYTLQCATGYGVNVAGTACVACATSLASATLANWAPAFYLYGSTQTAYVKQQSCVMAGTSNVLSALTCAIGYYGYGATAANQICVPLPTGYDTYTIANGAISALTCKTGYYLVRIGGAATTPNLLNCASCPSLSNAATCTPTPTTTQCATGYYLYLASSAYTCVACGTQIASCTQNGVKDSSATVTGVVCNAGYYLSAFTPYVSGSLTYSATCTICTTGSITCTSTCKGTETVACTSVAVATIVCMNGYYATTTGTIQCTACATNTRTCTSTAVSTCNNGFYADTTTTCTACPTTGTCPATCLTSGFYQSVVASGSTSACTSCGTGVAQCTQANQFANAVITVCASGYYLTTQSGSQACQLNSVITNVYQLTVGPSNVTYYGVVPSIIPLFTLTSSAPYQPSVYPGQFICASGMGVTWTSQNVPSCVACATSATAGCAFQCVGYVNTTTYAGVVNGCAQCTGSNVLTCDNFVQSMAITCLNGYYPNANASCVACPPNTFYLLSSTPALQNCVTGAALSVCPYAYAYQLGNCIACGSLGSACNGTCTSSGFYTTTSTCGACSDVNALSCASATVATSCKTGYYLSQSSICVVCGTNTLDCSVSVVASICNVGYSLISGSCVQCPVGFGACTSSSSGTQGQCAPGYFAASSSATTCSKCPAGAAVCTSASLVQVCMDGYYATALSGSNDGFDVQCNLCNATANFATCMNAQFAFSCVDGYYVTSTGACQGCGANGKACANGVISQCFSGYFVMTNGTTSCSACGTGADTCQNSTVATKCLQGYALSVTGNQANCISCSSGAANITGVTGCQNCSISAAGGSITCLSCSSGQTLSKNQCSCPAGQYLNGNACSACGTGCASCLSSNSCSQCQSGYGQKSDVIAAASTAGVNLTSAILSYLDGLGNNCQAICGSGQFINTAAGVIATSCSSCPANCTLCVSNSTCSPTCSSGYSYNSQDSTCQPSNGLLLSVLITLIMFILL